MTDSMKFGPEWLRNMSNDMGTSGNSSTSNSTTAPLGPRYQLAEYRYGREEMLSLFDKNIKTPEILPTFKTLYVDKVQCPLALTPSTEDEVVNSTRPWGLRSPVSFPPSTRGAGRGGSVDRGRGRTRGAYHTLIGYQRPTALYDEDARGLGRGERGWPERNGGNEIGGTAEWNGSPSSSPRKEYNSHGRGGGNLENWRRSRTEDDTGDGWRGVSTASNSSTYRWSRSTSWRDEDSSAATGGGGGNGDHVAPQITRSYSVSATSALDRTTNNSSSSSTSFKANSQPSQSEKPRSSGVQWEQEDMLPEWAMENPTDSGGSFDASGAFHGSNEGNEDDSGKKLENKASKKAGSADNCMTKTKEEKSPEVTDSEKSIGKPDGSIQKRGQPGEEMSPKSKDLSKLESITKAHPIVTSVEKNSLESIATSENSNSSSKGSLTEHQQQQHRFQKPPHLQQNFGGSSSASKPLPPPISEISDRMQEVADDMVEKLIMDDELTTKKSTSSSTASVSMLKGSGTVNSNSPTAPSLLQQPLINSHPLLPQPQPPPSSELWYYRDPQGKVQGPFTAAEMAEWYRAGYFDENLFVRRVCDSRFAALGELVKLCGNSTPFLSSHLIPPLVDIPVPSVPHLSQNSQPTPQQQVTMSAKPSVTPMLGTNDVMTLNLQLQFLQKQFLMRQQSVILNKLAASEPWSLLSPEQQQQLLNQQMSQVVLPDHLMSLSALSNSLSMMNSSTFALQQMLTTAKADISQTKPSQALHNPLGNFNNDFTGQSVLHNLMQNSVAPQTGIGQPPTSHSGAPGMENDPIKSLLLQLHMQNKMPATGPPSGPPMPNKWPANMGPLQSWPGASSTSTTPSVSMWDFGPIPQTKPDMKTEQQILEEQLQKEKLSRKAEIALNSSDRPETASENILQQQQQPQPMHQHAPSTQLQPQTIQPQAQPQPQPQPHQSQPQQQQPNSKREVEKSKGTSDEKIQKSVKHEEDQRKGKSKVEKKENKKVVSEEERRREAAEEKKRQKEEKKRQQLDEEKRRIQQQEEEERRQMLEEKKRQEEIDQLRRVKMLENAAAKPAKKSFERLSSSVAPWINTGFPGITTPGPNLAEIQKAERERRAEEQRLEQLMEHQRKAQMELLAQKENVLKWNAQPLKSLTVKSLAEIQAEEAKRLASEQATATSIEQRKKEEVVATQSSSYGNSAFGSIWNSRSTQNIAWNGKPAWGTTSTSGFWEEPAKIPTTLMSGSSASSGKQQSSSSRMLSKSQTISNIQSVKKENKPIIQNNINNVKQGGKGKNKKDSSTTSVSGQGSGGGGSASKKDDARNEFTSWCIKTLSSMNSSVDVPTFISFLQDIESPFEVKDYIRMYLGETKECSEFAKQFLERRSKYKNQQRAQNAHIDDMCSPAPAINPSSNDFQEVKGKGKKVKKNKMTKLDARILGFSVTAAQDRINVGDRDYGDAS